jgi:hypothetical protein
MEQKFNTIKKECEREEENCLYTSTTFYLWLSYLRKVKTVFLTVPLLLGGIASVEILSESENGLIKYLIALAAFIAGVLPSIFSALKIEAKIEVLDKSASKYKIFQGRFRRIRTISIHNSSFEEEFNSAISELEELKSISLTAPERYFVKSQKKIKKGDYNFSADEKNV